METLVPISDDWRPTEAAVTPIAKADRPVIGALATILTAQIAIFGYVAVRGFVRQPFSDMFDFLRAEFDLERGGDLIAYLAAPHNHQHLVWVRVLTALDVQVFHGTALIFLIAASLSILAGATGIGVAIWRGTSVRVVGAIGGLVAMLLMISAANALDCTQPINSVYALAFGFAALAILLFESAAEAERGRTALLLALSLTAGLGAVAGSAAGVAVLAALFVSAVRQPQNRPLIAPTLLVGLAATALVGSAMIEGGASPPSAGGVGHAAKIAQYFVVYAGLPWSAAGPLSRIRLATGLATIGVGAILLWRGSRRDGAAGRLERIGLDLILFALVTAAMAALARVDESPAVVVPLRYAVFMSAFQAGVICVLAPMLADRWDRLKRFATVAALVLALALLAEQAVAGEGVLQTSIIIRNAVAAFDAGARQPEMHQLIHPDFALAARMGAECRKRGLYR